MGWIAAAKAGLTALKGTAAVSKGIGAAKTVAPFAKDISQIGGGLLGMGGSSGTEQDIVEQNFANEKEALRKQQRAEFGSMIAQSGASGVSGSSFQDIFKNQTLEDASQMAQLKQREQNELTLIKNKKRAAKLKGGIKVLGAAASGVSKLKLGGDKSSKKGGGKEYASPSFFKTED